MEIEPFSGICPNCGSRAWDGDSGFCVNCFWQEGDDYFCPHWMDRESWRMGIEFGWRLSSKEARAALRGKRR